jgi:hypothetical protein
MKYEVPIIYTGLANFIVEADSPEEAKEKAKLKFNGGEPEDTLGNEWEEFDHFGNVEEMTK